MTSWYSNILTTTTSRISNLRSNWLGGDADGETEDDTHVCRVLRAYYTEKGRPFPPWLPPDPKAPPPAAPVYAQPQVGSRYGGLAPQQGGAGLSSLWDNNPAQQRQDVQSLRQARGVPPPIRGGSDPQAGGGRGMSPYGSQDMMAQTRPGAGQRAGSYQSTSGASLYSSRADNNQSAPPAPIVGGAPAGGAAAAGSAQDRLRNRLFGGGGARSAGPTTQSAFPPPQQQQQSSTGGYGRNASYGGSSGADSYEDRFAPGGMYDASGSSRGGGSDKPFMAANAPWATNEEEFMGGLGGGGGGGGGSSRGGGLPSGPRRMGGLPNGPRQR